MAKVLTQQQIDSLLTEPAAAKSSAETPAKAGKSIVVYDFKHPNRVSKDQNRSLESVHSQFASKLSSALSGILRSVVDVNLKSVDQVTYSEFMANLAVHSCTYTFTMKPLDGTCMLDFSPALTFAFVDRMFGGRGKGIEAERELTGIEISVMDKISKRAYQELMEAWRRLVALEIETVAVETTPQFTQIVPPSETVILVQLELNMLEVTGVLTLCYPFMTLEPVLAKMSSQKWTDAARSSKAEQYRKTVNESLRRVVTDVSVELARTAITMRDVLSVGVGDVIVSDTDTVEPAKVYVGGIEKFTARPGVRGRRRAIEIIDVSEFEGR